MSSVQEKVEEVLKHLKPNEPGTFLLVEPHLLYLEQDQAQSYLNAMKQENYRTGFHSETVEIIEDNLEKIFANFKSKKINLVDLGPGYPDKSLPICKFLAEKQIAINYYPVDVSETYLKMAADIMRPICNSVLEIQSKFEELQHHQQIAGLDSMYLMLGLTFMNFEPDFILGLLKQICPLGKIVIASEIVSFQTPESFLARYRLSEAQSVAFGPLKILGLRNESVEYQVRFKNRRIEMAFKLKEIPPALQEHGLKIDDEIITAVSYRYELEEFRKRLDKHFRACEIYLSPTRQTALAVVSTE